MLSKFVDENLELRLHSEQYADELNSVIHRNFEHLHKWMIWATKDYSSDSAKEFIKLSRQRFAETDIPNLFIFENNKIIGGIGFNNPDFLNKSIEIGYWLDKEHTGKGIISKCCKVLINFVFEDLSFNRIIIKCATENKKSQAIPERLGFVKEGIARQAGRLHDKFVDLVVYSMLKEEWEKSEK